MANLKEENCQVCSTGTPVMGAEQINQLKPEIPGWEVVEESGEKQLQKVFKFSDFKSALSFTNKVGDEAENQGHHPALLTEYGKVTITWWTHDIGGLHRNDFIMAAKTDHIAGNG